MSTNRRLETKEFEPGWKTQTIEIKSNPEEVEAERFELLKECQEDSDFDKNFVKPGYGTHELADRAALQMNMWYDYIVEHPSCVVRPELFALARQIADGMHNFYQKAGLIDAEEDES